jgi:hypothetical protein
MTNPFINAVGTKDHEDVLFKMRGTGQCGGRRLQNQQLGRNQGVLYKISRQGADQPYLGG